MPTHTATLRTIDRDPTRRLVTLTLYDGTQARLTYKQAAQLGFWLKPGQTIKVTGDLRDNILHLPLSPSCLYLPLKQKTVPNRQSDNVLDRQA